MFQLIGNTLIFKVQCFIYISLIFFVQEDLMYNWLLCACVKLFPSQDNEMNGDEKRSGEGEMGHLYNSKAEGTNWPSSVSAGPCMLQVVHCTHLCTYTHMHTRAHTVTHRNGYKSAWFRHIWKMLSGKDQTEEHSELWTQWARTT